MDIFKLLELSIKDLGMSLRLFNALCRARYFRVFDILFAGKDRIKGISYLGAVNYKELCNILLAHGIDLNDQEECNSILKKYKKYKSKQLGDCAVRLLDVPIRNVSNDIKMEKFLIEKGYHTIYDVLAKKPNELIKSLISGSPYLAEWDNSYYYVELMRNIFRYGIDIRDRDYCCSLNKLYRAERSSKLKESLENLKASIVKNAEFNSSFDDFDSENSDEKVISNIKN